MEPSIRGRTSRNNLIHSVVDEFLCKSSIHGAQYVLHSDLNWFTRLHHDFCATGSFGSSFLSLLDEERGQLPIAYIDYSNRPVDLIVQTNLEGISIPFPALTICPISSETDDWFGLYSKSLRLSDLFAEDSGEGSCAQCWPACVTDLADVSALWGPRGIKASKTYEGVPASNVFLVSDGDRPPPDLNVSTIQQSRNDKRSTSVYLRRERPELADTFGTYWGIAGLFLGIGALSVFEIIYFFLRGLATHFHQLLIEKQN